MRKHAFYILPLILVLTALLIFSSISYTGFVHADPQPFQINNVIIVYGTSTLNSTQIAWIAANYSMLICDNTMSQSVIQSIKTANPSIKVYAYYEATNTLESDPDWSVVNSHEDWFVHNTMGNRVIFSAYGSYMMNVSSGWADYFASHGASLIEGTYFDGLYGDDVWDELSEWLEGGSLEDAVTHEVLELSDIDSGFLASWHNDLVSLLVGTKNALSEELLFIVNTDESGSFDFLGVTDGIMYEGLIHAPWNPLMFWETYVSWNETYPFNVIDGLTAASGYGKIIISGNGCQKPSPMNNSAISMLIDTTNFCYVASLLGMNGENCYYEFYVNENGYTFDASVLYTTPFKLYNIGYPTNTYYQSENVYIRNFTQGLALLNPSNTSRFVTLSGVYYFTNGSVVGSSLELSEWTGISIFTELDSEPTPTPTATAAPYVPPSTSLGSGSGFDTLIALVSVLAVFALIIWPFLPKDRRRF